MTRDPRVNPKAGDVLRRDGLTRYVLKVVGNDVYWYRDVIKERAPAWISTWREWARKAEVVEVAP